MHEISSLFSREIYFSVLQSLFILCKKNPYPFKNTSEILDFFWSLSEFISCTNLSKVWTSIPGTCLETGSDSKYGFPRLRSTSTSKSRIWFRAVSIRYLSLFVLSNRRLASCKACKCAILSQYRDSLYGPTVPIQLFISKWNTV